MSYHSFVVASFALIIGLWAGCSDLTETPNCTTEDCPDGYECRADDLCHRLTTTYTTLRCVDNDGDGYGVGTLEQRQKCPSCEREGLCGEDCDDNDKNRGPNAGEVCNGRDDNCNGEIDEPTPCRSSDDCQKLNPFIPANTSVVCENQQCVVKMLTHVCFNGANPCPCNSSPVACEATDYARVPAPSECI